MNLLEEGYRRCAELTRANGTTYYWGARLLPHEQRRGVYGIYALCRLTDDIVDEPNLVREGVPADGTPAERLAAFEAEFWQALRVGQSSEPVMAAVVDTVRRYRIADDCFERFFHAMRLDLTETTWGSWPALRDGYMEGSAAVIGEMMVPVLQARTPEALGPARALGNAFQLTNFIRDVGEDLDRGRVYLPADELAAAGADPWQRRVTPAWRTFLASQIRRNRELYDAARPGVALMPGAAARCVATALVMYSRILDLVEQADYDVFSARRRVSPLRKVGIVAQVLVLGPQRAVSRLYLA